MNFENCNTRLEGNVKYYHDNVSEEMREIEQSIPVSNQMIANTPQPVQLNCNMYQQYMIPNPQDYRLPDPKARSIFESNVIEFWAPITDIAVPNVVPGRY